MKSQQITCEQGFTSNRKPPTWLTWLGHAGAKISTDAMPQLPLAEDPPRHRRSLRPRPVPSVVHRHHHPSPQRQGKKSLSASNNMPMINLVQDVL